jgi:hypothetical protein
MFDDCGRGGMRRWGSLRVLVSCVLLSTGAWGQSADAGLADAGSRGPSVAADAGQSASGAPSPAAVTDAGTRALPGRVEVMLHGVPVTVTASSVLEDAKEPGRYGPANLLDEDPGTLWAEGAKGSGAGEWVELSFPPNAPAYAFLVMPGNPKSAKLYKANARPRKARLELELVDGRKLAYELDFPQDFPAGGAFFVHGRPTFAVHSAKLAVLTVWPGRRYQDLCLGSFVPVFRGSQKRSLEAFLGIGSDLAPTLALFTRSSALAIELLLPPEESDVPAWLRTYLEVPRSGPLPAPEEEINMHYASGWERYTHELTLPVSNAIEHGGLFRLLPEPDGRGYVFEPLGPPKGPDTYSNFRVHWARVEGAWHVVGLDMKYQEETGDD